MEICSYCHTGKIEARKVVFVQWHEDDDAIVVDRIPAMVCDTCGEKSYEPRALENLHRLLLAVNNKNAISRPMRVNNT